MAHMGGSASIELDMPIDAVYEVLEDVEDAPTWQRGLDGIEAIERDAEGRATLSKSMTDIGVTKVTTTIRFSYEPNTAVRWEQVKGDLKSLVGAWELEDLGGGRTKVTYRLDGDTGRMLGLLIRGPVEHQVRKIIVDNRPNELAERLQRT